MPSIFGMEAIILVTTEYTWHKATKLPVFHFRVFGGFLFQFVGGFMNSNNDLTGQKFGELTVICKDKTIKTKRGNYITMWLCKCSCGNIKSVERSNLRSGKIKSCGHLRGIANGLYKTRIYQIWRSMKSRCYHKSNFSYKYCGLKGIKVCEDWLGEKGFINFYNWAMSNGYTDNLTIDRIDNNGNYEPSNCRWVTMKEQENNRTNNVYLKINGKTQTIAQWRDELNLSYYKIKTIYSKQRI